MSSSFYRKLGACSVAGAVLVALGGLNAGASAQTSSQPLNTVVGETVIVTTDQAGNSTGFNLVLVNSQVSGQGDGTITIPLGDHGEKTVNADNSAGQVQNSFSISGPYKPQLPISVVTSVSVNGQSVDADEAYNLDGEVEVTYTMKNNTTREQTITYRGIDGETISTQAEIPVPFGNEFRVTFGDGWFIEDAGKMTQKTVPGGTGLSTTAILFPLVQGMAGGTTQTYTVKARAENASLPGTTSNAIPLDLRTYDGGLALKVAPGIDNGVLRPVNDLLDGAIGNIMGAAGLISGYTGAFESLNLNYIDPLAKELGDVKVDPKLLSQRLSNLELGLTQLATLLDSNQVAANVVVDELKKAAKVSGVDLVGLVKWFEELTKTVGPASAEAADALNSLNAILGQLNVSTLDDYLQADMQNWCNAVANTSKNYGYATSTGGNEGSAALQTALGSKSGVTLTPTEQADLTALQQLLNAQSKGSLAPSGAFRAATLTPGLTADALASVLEKDGNLPAAQAQALAKDIVNAIATPGCQLSTEAINDVILPLATDWVKIAPSVADLINDLNSVAQVASSEELSSTLKVVLKGLISVTNKLTNTQCTNSDIVTPLAEGLKQYGVDGIAAHLGPILGQMLQNCGLAQIVAFLGTLDGVLADSLSKFAVKVDGLGSDVPKIAKAADNIDGIAKVAGGAFDAIPGLGEKVAELMGGVTSKVGVADGALTAKVGNFAAEFNASILAMSARTAAGDGSPYGNATGPNTQTVAIYQITQEPAAPYKSNWATAIVLAIVFLILAVGLGTYLHHRRRRPKLPSEPVDLGGVS